MSSGASSRTTDAPYASDNSASASVIAPGAIATTIAPDGVRPLGHIRWYSRYSRDTPGASITDSMDSPFMGRRKATRRPTNGSRVTLSVSDAYRIAVLPTRWGAPRSGTRLTGERLAAGSTRPCPLQPHSQSLSVDPQLASGGADASGLLE